MRAFRFALAAVLLTAAGCAPFGEGGPGKAPSTEAKLVFKRVGFDAMAQWPSDNLSPAFEAFHRSCEVIVKRVPSDPMGGVPEYGTVEDWVAACESARNAKSGNQAELARFFEAWFQPVQVFNGDDPVGLYTGYYEPELNGSRKRSPKFHTPLYLRPTDLVQVELGAFRPNLKGERIAGKVAEGKLVPYATRADIVSGALSASTSRPLVYVDDAVAAFFLQIQGSGRVKLNSGETIRAAFDGQNGHSYTAIGRVLVDRGEIDRSQLSMQSIRSWLDANPEKSAALMNENASYVFFKELPIDDPSKGADGAHGVPLIAEASLAVDLKYHALGAPIWIDAKAPAADATQEDGVLRKLYVAQDTGGAIRGPIRGDIYWGVGREAESIAGRMAHKGRMFVLLPKAVSARLN